MTHLRRIAFIGNALPRRCGIATFTTDLQGAVDRSGEELATSIVAMTDGGCHYEYGPNVGFEVADSALEDYARAADFLNAGQFDVVSLQHEFGIFGGEAGSHVVALLSRLTVPIVTTLHTITAQPTQAERSVLERVVALSARVVAMSEKGRELLCSIYEVPDGKIDVIAHGIPDVAFSDSSADKALLGYAGRPVILTFGLLSPNKGIEVMIDAMPAILASVPDAIYVVLGATHPNLVREQGEAYRNSLVAHVRSLGVQDHVVFLDQFVDLPTLLQFISMCDVYVTPYLNEAQMTSGTLSYSFGLGRAVVSTPYWHAQDLLGDGRGILVPFGDAARMGTEIAGLLTDDARRNSMRERAYAASRSMTWANTALRYRTSFERACRGTRRLKVVPALGQASPRKTRQTPAIKTDHFVSMCDDTGLLQHAVHSVPDRDHGYCVDDNARALLVACGLNMPGEVGLPDLLTARFASFIQHAWNPANGRFRNFMSFGRRWLEDQGSEDSHGRVMWALGECAGNDNNASRRRWAAALFAKALPVTETFTSPRAWAFTLLGLDAFCSVADGQQASQTRRTLADRLLGLLTAVERPDWTWFETGLSYDNARLPQALLATGSALTEASFINGGLRSLRWLMSMQTSPAGLFRPVGSEGFGDHLARPRTFDQQPLEATATIAACTAALRADGDPRWEYDRDRAFAWFLGDNDLGTPVVDLDTGSCRDGLHPDRANENRGGESAVSYLLGLLEVRQVERLALSRVKLAPSLS